VLHMPGSVSLPWLVWRSFVPAEQSPTLQNRSLHPFGVDVPRVSAGIDPDRDNNTWQLPQSNLPKSSHARCCESADPGLDSTRLLA